MTSLRVGRHKEIPPEFYGTPKEVWGFHVPRARGTPATIGRRFIADNDALFGHEEIRGTFQHVKTLESLGATHVIFRQHHMGLRIHRAFITVHIDRNGRVYMAKNRAVPSTLLPDEKQFLLTKTAARRRARLALRGSLGPVRAVGAVEPLWYPRQKKLRPAYKVRFSCENPRGDWIIYVDAEQRTILEKADNLAAFHRFATVFDPNPVVALGGDGTCCAVSREACARRHRLPSVLSNSRA